MPRRAAAVAAVALAAVALAAACSTDQSSAGSDGGRPPSTVGPRAQSAAIAFAVQQLLTGDWETTGRLFQADPATVAAVRRTIEALPPLVDVPVDDVERQLESGRADLRLNLRSPDGDTGVALVLRPTAGGQPVLVGTAGRTPDGPPIPWAVDGRLRREYFVGSPELRIGRLLAAFPKDEYGLPRTDGDERGDLAGFWFAEADIQAEGLAGFYGDHAGEFAPRFPEFARAIGAPRKAGIVDAANALFPAGTLTDPEARANAALDLTGPLDDAGERYDEVDEEATPLLVAYVTDHPDAFLA